MGALIMTHSDDNGLVLPPKLAPTQVVIVPIYKNAEEYALTCAKGKEIAQQLKAAGVRVKLDDNDKYKPGWKFSEYEFKGVPLRIAIGPRDIQNNNVELARRDLREKNVVPMDGLTERILGLLEEIQQSLFNKAKAYREASIHKVDTYDEFKEIVNGKGGFVLAHWDGTGETEQKIKEETKATIRCIPMDNPQEEGKCIYSGKPSAQRVLFAVAY
jgi:prolyl-tRNA synthetase